MCFYVFLKDNNNIFILVMQDAKWLQINIIQLNWLYFEGFLKFRFGIIKCTNINFE